MILMAQLNRFELILFAIKSFLSTTYVFELPYHTITLSPSATDCGIVDFVLSFLFYYKIVVDPNRPAFQI